MFDVYKSVFIGIINSEMKGLFDLNIYVLLPEPILITIETYIYVAQKSVIMPSKFTVLFTVVHTNE